MAWSTGRPAVANRMVQWQKRPCLRAVFVRLPGGIERFLPTGPLKLVQGFLQLAAEWVEC